MPKKNMSDLITGKHKDKKYGMAVNRYFKQGIGGARFIFLVIAVVFISRSIIIEPFQIPSGSMKPTLKVGDFIVLNKLSYGIRLPILHKRIITWSDIERGDVIVFNFPKDPKINFIKRVVGMPGDLVEYDGVDLFINDMKVIKTRSISDDKEGNNFAFYEQLGNAKHLIYRNLENPAKFFAKMSFQIPSNKYFVMGDNRDNSNDSRFWGFVDLNLIQGKASFVWMNWDDFFSIPGFSDDRFIE
jgi:signal peptidase I